MRKNDPSDADFLKMLLAQEPTLQSTAFADSRRQLLVRLARAERRERVARWTTLAVVAGVGVLWSLLFAADMHKLGQAYDWPDWVKELAVMAMLLSPVLALALVVVYVARHRRELRRSRDIVQRAAFAEVIRQIGELRAAKPPDERAPGGFTLVETLVVIAIIGLLACLLLPALSRSKALALSASCQGNISQLAKALAMYVAGSQKYPGTHSSILRPDSPGLSNPRPVTGPWVIWNEQLLPLVANSSGVFRCPAHVPSMPMARTWTNFSYGYNAFGSGFQGPLQNLGLGRIKPPDDLQSNNPMMEVAESKVRDPEDMIALVDLADHGLGFLGATVTPGLQYFEPARRHREGANALFCDGHVEWAKTERWSGTNAASRRRWNNDHEPHPETW